MKNDKNLWFKKYDLIIYFALIVVLAALFIFSASFYKKGGQVYIYSKGEIVKVLPLNKNTQYKIENEYGYNLIVIEGGSAYIKEADCPDGICKKSPRINKVGQSIICVPHKVKVEIKKLGVEGNYER